MSQVKIDLIQEGIDRCLIMTPATARMVRDEIQRAIATNEVLNEEVYSRITLPKIDGRGPWVLVFGICKQDP